MPRDAYSSGTGQQPDIAKAAQHCHANDRSACHPSRGGDPHPLRASPTPQYGRHEQRDALRRGTRARRELHARLRAAWLREWTPVTRDAKRCLLACELEGGLAHAHYCAASLCTPSREGVNPITYSIAGSVLPPILALYLPPALGGRRRALEQGAWLQPASIPADAAPLRGALALVLRSVACTDPERNYCGQATTADPAAAARWRCQCWRLLLCCAALLGGPPVPPTDLLLQAAAARTIAVLLDELQWKCYPAGACMMGFLFREVLVPGSIFIGRCSLCEIFCAYYVVDSMQAGWMPHGAELDLDCRAEPCKSCPMPQKMLSVDR